MKRQFLASVTFIFLFLIFSSSTIQKTNLTADDILDQTLYAKNESGYDWVIGLQLNRKDTHFKGKINKVVYEIKVIENEKEVDRTSLFSLDLGDYLLEDANGHYTASQLYKLKYIATKYYEQLDFKLVFREIYFTTGEVAKFDSQGNYQGKVN